jgi:hypothetical protein
MTPERRTAFKPLPERRQRKALNDKSADGRFVLVADRELDLSFSGFSTGEQRSFLFGGF